MTTVEQETLPVTLKPCPFCGGEAAHHVNDHYEFVECVNGKMRAGDCAIVPSTGWRKRKDNAAITAWNTRADHEPRAVEVGLREALRASLAKRSRPTMDPPWTAAFNAALDMVARDVAPFLAAQSPAPTEGEGVLEALDEALKQYAEPLSMLNGHELGERLAGDVAEIVRHARLRAPRPSTQPQADAGSADHSSTREG